MKTQLFTFPLAALPLCLSAATTFGTLAEREQAEAAFAAEQAQQPAPPRLEAGWVAHVHELKLKKGVESQPPGQSFGQFVLTSNPFELSAHKNTPLKFWKQPAGYKLEAVFSATEAGWHTFVTELSVPPLELRYGRKHAKKVPGNLYAEHTLQINGDPLLASSVHPKQAKQRPLEQRICGWTEQHSASVFLQPGHYKAQLWFAAKGSYRLNHRSPRSYTLPAQCPNAGQKFTADSNSGDQLPLRILVRRPDEHAPQPALASDFSHSVAEDTEKVARK